MLDLTQEQIENMRKDPSLIDWWLTTLCYNFSEDLIIEFQNKVDWLCISCCQKLSNNFIRKNFSKLNKNLLLKNKNISEEIKQLIKLL